MELSVCTRHLNILLSILIGLSSFAEVTQVALAQTRDPSYYSRPGTKDFQWPNPGDPDYRY